MTSDACVLEDAPASASEPEPSDNTDVGATDTAAVAERSETPDSSARAQHRSAYLGGWSAFFGLCADSRTED